MSLWDAVVVKYSILRQKYFQSKTVEMTAYNNFNSPFTFEWY